MADSRKKSNKTAKSKSASQKPVGKKPVGKKPAVKPDAHQSTNESVEKVATETVSPPPPDLDNDPYASVLYESVSPKAITTTSGMGFGSIVLTVLVFVVMFGAVYITWPQWSPYVADHIPLLEFKQKPDSLLRKLTDRVNALEAEAGERVNFETTIAEMDTERTRLQGGVKSLLGRLSELESELGTVRQMIAATDLSSGDDETKLSFQRISDRLVQLEKSGGMVAGLSKRMNEIETASKGGANLAIEQAESASQRLSEAVTSIQTRLTQFEEQRARPTENGQNRTGSAVVLAISQLRKTVLSGQPFARDLEAVQAVSGNDHGMKAALLVLNKHSQAGIATLSNLQAQFKAIAGTMVSVTRQTDKTDWIENATNRLRSLISIRQVDGTAPAQSADSFVLRAENRLEAGDLEGAVEVISELVEVSAPAATVANPWLSAATARLSTERAVTSLHVYAVSLIAATTE